MKQRWSERACRAGIGRCSSGPASARVCVRPFCHARPDRERKAASANFSFAVETSTILQHQNRGPQLARQLLITVDYSFWLPHFVTARRNRAPCPRQIALCIELSAFGSCTHSAARDLFHRLKNLFSAQDFSSSSDAITIEPCLSPSHPATCCTSGICHAWFRHHIGKQRTANAGTLSLTARILPRSNHASCCIYLADQARPKSPSTLTQCERCCSYR